MSKRAKARLMVGATPVWSPEPMCPLEWSVIPA